MFGVPYKQINTYINIIGASKTSKYSRNLKFLIWRKKEILESRDTLQEVTHIRHLKRVPINLRPFHTSLSLMVAVGTKKKEKKNPSLTNSLGTLVWGGIS